MWQLLVHDDADVNTDVDADLDDEQEEDAKVKVGKYELAGLHLGSDETNESMHTFPCNRFSAWQLAAITRLIMVYMSGQKMLLLFMR